MVASNYFGLRNAQKRCLSAVTDSLTALTKEIKMLTTSNAVPAVAVPESLKHLIGQVTGTKAPCLKEVSVDTPMDPSQRDFNPNDVIKYISKSQGLDWNLFGYVTVVENPKTGQQTMINGQHRTSIVKTLAPMVKTVPAHIISTDDPQYAAKLFAYLNGVASRNVSREQLLWAEVLAGDKDAIATQQKLIYCDLACGKVNQGKDIKQVSRATFEKCIKLGLDETRYAAAIIARAYPERDDFDNLLYGLVRLLSLKSYQGLMDNTKTLGKKFDEWFVQHFARNHTYKESTNIVTRTDPWCNSIAYGIYKKFWDWMKREGKGHHCPAKTDIAELYKLANDD